MLFDSVQRSLVDGLMRSAMASSLVFDLLRSSYGI